MRRADALVLGAGPAGSTSARLLAERGLSVTLLDRRSFPRPKVCGGGVPVRCRALLPPAYRSAVLDTVRHARLTAGFGRGLLVRDRAEAEVVDRAAFDHALVAAAQEAGARFRAPAEVAGLQRAGEQWHVRCADGETFTAPRLVIADGATSRARRLLGEPPPALGLGLEAYLPRSLRTPAEEPATAVFHLGADPAGYAWAFPRGERWAVGIGTARWPAPDLPRRLSRFCRSFAGRGARPPERPAGAPLPRFCAPRPWYARDGVCLVGDAAGLVDPLTGEGIYYALCSAHAAAAAIAQRRPDHYNAALQEDLLPELTVAARYARRLAHLPRWALALLLRLPRGRRYAAGFTELLGGRLTYRELSARMHGGRPG